MTEADKIFEIRKVVTELAVELIGEKGVMRYSVACLINEKIEKISEILSNP